MSYNNKNFTERHWREKEHPGKSYMEHWGWSFSLNFQHEPVNETDLEYFIKRIVNESRKWGANFINFYATTCKNGHTPVIPFLTNDEKFIPVSWETEIDTNWDTDIIKKVLKYSHEKGFIIDCFTWMTDDPNIDYWEWLFRETGNTLIDGILCSWDGFEEEYYPFDDGCEITERISRYHPGAFTVITPGSWDYIPKAPPPLFLMGIMCAMATNNKNFCSGQTDRKFNNRLFSDDNFNWMEGNAWNSIDVYPYSGFQADCRFLKTRSKEWMDFLFVGGGNYIDKFLKEANDFFRRRLNEGYNGSTAIWWHNEASSTTPDFLRNAIYGISQDPIKAAVATRLITTGKGGIEDLLCAGTNSYEDYYQNIIIQNNYLRIVRDVLIDTGTLLYDKNVSAHYDIHREDSRTIEPVIITKKLFATVNTFNDEVKNEKTEYIDIKLMENENQINSIFVKQIYVNGIKHKSFPRKLSVEGCHYDIFIDISLTIGQYHINIDKLQGELYAYIFLDEEIIAYTDGKNTPIINIVKSGIHTIRVLCDTKTNAIIRRAQIIKISSNAIHHNITEEAGNKAELLESIVISDSKQQIYNEQRKYTCYNDMPYQILDIKRHVCSDNNTDIFSLLGCEGYNRLLLNGECYEKPFEIDIKSPVFIELIDISNRKPNYIIAFLKGESIQSISWNGDGLLSIKSCVKCKEVIKICFLVPDGLYKEDEYCELLNNVGFEERSFKIEDDKTLEFKNDSSIPLVKFASIQGKQKGPYYVKEKRKGDNYKWWTIRGSQKSKYEEKSYLKLYIDANDSSSLQLASNNFLNNDVAIGWGCQNTIALREDISEERIIVKVMEVTPLINAPRLIFKKKIDSVIINGVDWRYFSDNIVFLPNEKGLYEIKTFNNNNDFPNLITTALNIQKCQWDDISKCLIIDGHHPPWFKMEMPHILNYRVAIKKSNYKLKTITNNGTLLNEELFRIEKRLRNEMLKTGYIIEVKTGCTKLYFEN